MRRRILLMASVLSNQGIAQQGAEPCPSQGCRNEYKQYAEDLVFSCNNPLKQSPDGTVNIHLSRVYVDDESSLKSIDKDLKITVNSLENSQELLGKINAIEKVQADQIKVVMTISSQQNPNVSTTPATYLLNIANDNGLRATSIKREGLPLDTCAGGFVDWDFFKKYF